jgi:hypothetical protein
MNLQKNLHPLTAYDFLTLDSLSSGFVHETRACYLFKGRKNRPENTKEVQNMYKVKKGIRTMQANVYEWAFELGKLIDEGRIETRKFYEYKGRIRGAEEFAERMGYELDVPKNFWEHYRNIPGEKFDVPPWEE